MKNYRSLFLYAFLLCCVFNVSYGQSISTVKIGDQIWTNKNLDKDRFNDSSRIPVAKSALEWKEANAKKQPVSCYFNFDRSTYGKNGRLYNWYAVMDKRGLAPKGFHIPSSLEANLLNHFTSFNSDDDSTYLGPLRAYGFNPRMDGYCNPEGEFMDEGYFVAWWTSEEDQTNSWTLFGYGNYYDGDGDSDYGKQYGFYVRCLKDILTP